LPRSTQTTQMALPICRAILVACCLHAVAAANVNHASRQTFLAPARTNTKVISHDADARRVRGVCMMVVCALHDFPWTGCVKNCQVAMSRCLASKGLDKYDECEVEVPKILKNATSTGQYLVARPQGKSGSSTPNSTILMLRRIEDQCVSACGPDADSSCTTECQVRMYTCLDYNRDTPEGKDKHEACVADTIATYKKFAADWNATHPYLIGLGRHVSAARLERIQDECVIACGRGVDSSCVPECQVKMYTCLDHDQQTEEGAKKFGECKDEVITKYKGFAEDWNATHPYLLSHSQYQIRDADVYNVAEGCEAACSADSDASCVPECQVQMYKCFDFDRATQEGAAQHKACVKKQTQFFVEYAEAVKNSSLSLPSFAAEQGPKGMNRATLVELHQIADQCKGACGVGVDSSCVVECQVQMYTCLDHDRKTLKGSARYLNCTDKVVKKYEKFAADWDATHPYLLSLKNKVDANKLQAIYDGCTDACGDGVDSSCVPECQVQMYRCLDHDSKTEEGAVKYKKCEQDVLTKYEAFADDWDATHPYLLAIRRHASAAQLQDIFDDCVVACGKDVDSSCVPECQVQSYTCLDNDVHVPEGAEQYKACKEEVIKKYGNFSADWDATHPY